MAGRKKPDEAIAKLTTLVDALSGRGKDVLRISKHVVMITKQLVEANASKAEATTEVNGIVTRAEGTYGLNKKAMKALYQFNKMTDAVKSDYLRTLLPGLEAMLPVQLDLFAETKAEESEGEEEQETAPEGAPLQ